MSASNSQSTALPAVVRQEIEEWVATVAPRSAQREFRAALKRVARLAFNAGREAEAIGSYRDD